MYFNLWKISGRNWLKSKLRMTQWLTQNKAILHHENEVSAGRKTRKTPTINHITLKTLTLPNRRQRQFGVEREKKTTSCYPTTRPRHCREASWERVQLAMTFCPLSSWNRLTHTRTISTTTRWRSKINRNREALWTLHLFEVIKLSIRFSRMHFNQSYTQVQIVFETYNSWRR